mgnify:FL=1
MSGMAVPVAILGHTEYILCAADYTTLKGMWKIGERDRELALHLAFLAWYGLVEPWFLTGFTKNFDYQELQAIWHECYQFLNPEQAEDAEILYTLGLMLSMFAYVMGGDMNVWESKAEAFRTRYRRMLPRGISEIAPQIFQSIGLYGVYFMGQSRVVDGF